MSTPTQYLPAQLVVDLHATLARLRVARTVDPDHDERTVHTNCYVCATLADFNRLIEKLPRTMGSDKPATVWPSG